MKGGLIYAEFHADYDYDGPKAAGTKKHKFLTVKVWNMKFSKINYFEVRLGSIDAEFHADYDYDSPRAPGPRKV